MAPKEVSQGYEFGRRIKRLLLRVMLGRTIDGLRERNRQLSIQIHKLKEKNRQYFEQYVHYKDMSGLTLDREKVIGNNSVENAKEIFYRDKYAIASKSNVERGKIIRSLVPLNKYVPFTRCAIAQAEEVKSDVYIAHGVQAFPAAVELARATSGRAICDCIEIPSFAERAAQSRWDSVNTNLVDRLHEGYLYKADGLLTVGWTLADRLSKFKRPVHVIPNYRPRMQWQASSILRERCGIDESAPLLLAISIIASGLENVIEAFSKLPPETHIVFMGKFAPEEYRKSCHELISRYGLDERVHFLDPVPYEELLPTASSADVGLIIRDPAIPNNFVSLPNRIFDYLAAGLPVITPPIPDIARIVKNNNAGIVLKSISSDDWFRAMKKSLKLPKKARGNALRFTQKNFWENIERELYEFLGQPESVTFVGYTDLIENNRTMRMVRTLDKMGVKVKVYCNSRNSIVDHDVDLVCVNEDLID